MKILDPSNLEYAPLSMVDPGGRVFIHESRIFRLVTDPGAASVYKDLLSSHHLETLFSLGLVRTWVPSDIAVENVTLLLEHEKIPFESHPAEFTNSMHWQAACCMVKLIKALNGMGYTIKDAHPWNTMFHRGKPVFIDFGSIIPGKGVSAAWLNEFYLYFGVPVWLAASRFRRYSRDFRREHRNGFGLSVMEHRLIRKFIWLRLRKQNTAVQNLEWIDRWLGKHRPARAIEGNWASYDQSHGANFDEAPKTEKAKFVHQLLNYRKPTSVLDCAANNGYFSFMAAHLGAEVAAFDYEESNVDNMLERAVTERLKITPALMDFLVPTPPFSLGLRGSSAFERFRSDMVLALGLVHHVCISQGLPLSVFCEICARFAKKDILIEFVHPTDFHISKWHIPEYIKYSLADLEEQFLLLGWQKQKQTDIHHEGIERAMLHFRFATNETVSLLSD